MKLDENYDRTRDEITKDEDKPKGGYLQKIGITKKDTWIESKVDNNEDQKFLYQQEIPEWKKRLAEEGWSNSEISKLMLKYDNIGTGQDGIIDQVTNPKRGVMVIKNSYNDERDLRNAYSSQLPLGYRDKIYKPYMRPAVGNEKDKVFWSDMVMDNWRVAATKAEVKVDSLKYVGRDNIVTKDTENVFVDIMGGGKGAKTQTFQHGTPEFDKISKTVHGRGVIRMLDTNKDELGGKTVTSYTVTHEEIRGEPDYKWNMLIKIEYRPVESKTDFLSPGGGVVCDEGGVVKIV